jgi:LacI family transcriptional regulator
VFHYFNENKIKVPEQVAQLVLVITSQVLTPKLSTVDQPSHEMELHLQLTA